MEAKKPVAPTSPAKPAAATPPSKPTAAKEIKPVEIPKNVTHKDMLNRQATVFLRDRLEQQFEGTLAGFNEYGVLMTGTLRNKKPYIDLTPWAAINNISCTLDDGNGADD